MPFNANAQASLDVECITPTKLEEGERVRVWNAQIRLLYPNYTAPVASLSPVAATPIDLLPPDSAPVPDNYTTLVLTPNAATYPSPLGPFLWESNRVNRINWNSNRYQDELFFTLQYLIPHSLINIIFSLIIQISRLTSKPVLSMVPILVHMQIVTKVIRKCILEWMYACK